MSTGFPTQTFRFCPRCGQQNGSSPSPKHFVCPDCGYTFYSNAAAAVAAFLCNEAGEFLFVKRGREPQKGKWNVPGGFVDPFEPVEQALLRETNEEVGIGIESFTFLASYPNTYTYREVTYHTVDMFFLCTPVESEASPEQDEVTAIVWKNPVEMAIEEIAFESTKQALRHYREQVTGNREQ